MNLENWMNWSFSDLKRLLEEKPGQKPINPFTSEGRNWDSVQPHIPDSDIENYHQNPFKYWEDEWDMLEREETERMERLLERRKHDDRVIDEYKSPHLYNYPTKPLEGDDLMYEWMRRQLAPPLHDMEHDEFFREMRRKRRQNPEEGA